MNSGSPREPLPENFSDEEDSISFAPLWELIRKYQRWLEVGLGILLVLGVGLLGALWIVLPQQSRATMDISFLFPEASSGYYPNKLPFHPDDLLENVLLRRNFQINQVNRWMIYDDFKSSFSMRQSGQELLALGREFQGKLDDRKLTAAEKQKLEDEFRSKLVKIPNTTHQIIWNQTGRSAQLIPTAEIEKILADIPRLWAQEYVEQKKVLVNSAQVPGKMVASSNLDESSFLLTELTNRIRALVVGLNEIKKLPGIYLTSLPNGKNIADLDLKCLALLEGKLPKIRTQLLQSKGAEVNLKSLESAFAVQLQARRDRAQTSNQNIQSALATFQDYLAGRAGGGFQKIKKPETTSASDKAPLGNANFQIGDAFFAKISEFLQNKDGNRYLYQLLENIRDARLASANDASAVLESQFIVDSLLGQNRGTKGDLLASAADMTSAKNDSLNQFSQPLADGVHGINDIITKAEQLRAIALGNYGNPQTAMYRIVVPVDVTRSSFLSLRNAGLGLGAFVSVGMAGILLACWIFENVSQVASKVETDFHAPHS
jgi:hypothetical protein